MDADVADKESLKQATLLSNRALAVLRLVTVDASGTESVQNRKLFRRDDFLNGDAYSFSLNQFCAALRAKKGTTVRLEVVTADGAESVPVSFVVE